MGPPPLNQISVCGHALSVVSSNAVLVLEQASVAVVILLLWWWSVVSGCVLSMHNKGKPIVTWGKGGAIQGAGGREGQ